MGSCVSAYRNAQTGSVAAIGPSPVKESAVNGDPLINDGPHKSQWSTTQSTTAAFRGYGSSKEENFFDSQPWLESDCDDDFFSVRGDFTPSRGSTPVHSFRGTPRVDKITPPLATSEQTPTSVPELSPTTKKKKLSELFKESIGNADELAAIFNNNENHPSAEKDVSIPAAEPDKTTTTIQDIVPSPGQGSPQVSGTNSVCNSERISNSENKEKANNWRSAQQSCLPSLMSCRPSIERRKKMTPVIAVHD